MKYHLYLVNSVERLLQGQKASIFEYILISEYFSNTVLDYFDHFDNFWSLWTILDHLRPFWTILNILNPYFGTNENEKILFTLDNGLMNIRIYLSG